MKTKIIHTPDGVRDWLPDECLAKNEILGKIEDTFIHYGYQKIESPVFEFAEVFDASLTNKSQNQLYTLSDEKGDILALRADMTPPIVRVATTAYKNENTPLRFFYSGNVFSNINNKHLQGKLRESSQAGIELFGIDCPLADSEVVEISIKSLLAVGINDFVIHIGHAGFMKGVLESCNFNSDTRNKILDCIDNLDYVGIGKIVKELNIDLTIKETLENLPLLVGDFEMLEMYSQKIKNPLAASAIKRLLEIHSILKNLGLEKYISFDLGMVSHINYYTGLVFRAYTYGSGYPDASGGRYDNLAEKFGKKMAAVGVTLKVNNIIDSVVKRNIVVAQAKKKILFFYEDDSIQKKAFDFVAKCRNKGYIVENIFVNGCNNNCITLAFTKDGNVNYSNGYTMEKTTLSYDATEKILIEGVE